MTSLRIKLTIALLATGLSGVLIIAILVQTFTINEFDNFLLEQQRADIVDDMVGFYEIFGSWEEMTATRDRLPRPPENDTNQPGPPDPPIKFTLYDIAGNMIIPEETPPSEPVRPPRDPQQGEPIIVDGETVGYIFFDEGKPDRNLLGEAYLERFNQFLVTATVGAIGVALILSFWFARSLSHPLREIATAIQSISHGELEQQIPVRSRDEIGQVATAFNQMSTELVRANQLRRQMTADIAHELRTPLVVIVGYLASLSEGLLKPSPERFKIMHEEAVHLQRLVDDLRTLSLADAGELSLNIQKVSAKELLNRTADAFSPQAEQQIVTLSVQAAPDVLLFQADPDRIFQVLSNLVSNALRHTPKQGQITLASHFKQDHVELSVQDTGSGIATEHLPHIFERFYRVDSARHEEQNESGLGLAIAKSIVEAHGGSIAASSVAGTGTTITINFPMREHTLSG